MTRRTLLVAFTMTAWADEASDRPTTTHSELRNGTIQPPAARRERSQAASRPPFPARLTFSSGSFSRSKRYSGSRERPRPSPIPQ